MSSRVYIVQFDAHPPALLPIHILLWLQTCHAAFQSNTSEDSEVIQICGIYNIILQKFGLVSQVYYTEADQLVRVDEKFIEPLLRASNRSTIIMGYRKQKDQETSAKLYANGLKKTRPMCGRRGFFLDTVDYFIRDSQHLAAANLTSHDNPLLPKLKIRGARIWKKQQTEAIALMKKSYQHST